MELFSVSRAFFVLSENFFFDFDFHSCFLRKIREQLCRDRWKLEIVHLKQMFHK